MSEQEQEKMQEELQNINQSITPITMLKNPSYIYKSSEEETKRLNLQSKLIEESAFEHLKKAGLTVGQKVVDMGCGTGVMTTYLAEQVGPTGHVYAIDIDEKQLEVTRKTLSTANQNLDNVTFICCDIEDENCQALTEILESIDLIYMRFVMMHLKHPYTAAKNLMRILKKGGCLASQESILSSTHCEPIESPLICEYYAHSIELGRILGTTRSIGQELSKIYADTGFTEETYYKVTHRIAMKDAAPVRLRSMIDQRSLLIEHKLMTEVECDNYVREIERLAEINDRALVFDQGHIIVRK
jgi:ubiquinone/menaquinone biosynthesis C-methylase UbiE